MSTAAVIHPNEVAEFTIGRDYLSYSAVSTFQRCPLQFYFRYIAGLPEETVSASLVFGGAIHAAAEFHFNELMAGNPRPDLDSMLDVYQDTWRDRNLDQVQFGKADDVNTLGKLADRVIGAFQSSEFAEPAGRIIAVEEELRGELVADCPNLLARVDLIVDEGDTLVVTDLKTARSRWSQDQVDGSAEQLLLYHELAKHLAPDKSLRLEFAVVTKTKQPAVSRHVVQFDNDRLNRTKRVVQRVWQAIQAGHFYPAPSTMNCSTCAYREACRDWSGVF